MCALFVGGVRGAGRAGGDALCITLLAGDAGGAGCHALGAILYAGCCGGWVGFGPSFGVWKFPLWQFSRYTPPHIGSKV